jgi:hypothetical protein
VRSPRNDGFSRLYALDVEKLPSCRAWTVQWEGSKPTVILEAVVTHDLWIWNVFFGLPGTLNNITVLDRSPIFRKAQDGLAVLFHYQVNGNKYKNGYYLTDGIYPKYATLIQSISEPRGKKTGTLPSFKRCVTKMWNMLLGFYKHDMPSSNTLDVFGNILTSVLS